jgi:hypothetical protein
MPNTTESKEKSKDSSTDKPLDLSKHPFQSFSPSGNSASETASGSTAQTNTAQIKAPENQGGEATRNGPQWLLLTPFA